ncbi:MAG: putative lipid II flippase FtsW [Oscillospiraceae bacterium]|nr:putative lipid II flippase FtsW [Oscillospiraceae bacterium]
MDLPFLLLTLIILVVGLVMVLSASFARAYYEEGNAAYVFTRQLLFSVSGVGWMIIASRLRPSVYRRTAFWVLVVAFVLLLIVPVIGNKVNGARRWLSVGGAFTFQPSEVAKLGMVMSFSAMASQFGERMKTFKYGVLPFFIVIVAMVGLLALEPHLSACVIIVLLGMILMFAGGTRIYWFLLVGGAAGGAGWLLVTKFAYASTRIATWQDPFSNKLGGGWQIIQSLYAIGSGGLLGLGLGQSRQKYLYLPEEHNDFIFSIICEELGFIGAVLILVLFLLLIIRGYWLAMHAKTRFASLVITGITSLLALQVFLNVAVVTNLIPATGISLPFFSYGGTALWIQLVEMGIVLALSREIEDK